jgi:iron-sulfur cluster repair protein YtfE (RIC family)
MTTEKLPGTDAARHGTGDADLTIMIAAHQALRSDLVALARATQVPNRAQVSSRHSPRQAQSVAAGWELFKRQLHLHHHAEDDVIWPALRERLGHSVGAQSVLAEMEAEHELIDPLLAAVDAAFASASGPAGGHPGHDGLADAVDALTVTITGHLSHEEKDALPLIGTALTAAEWRRVGLKMARHNGLSASGEMFSWLIGTAAPGQAQQIAGTLPPPVRLLYRAVWKPRFEKTERW